MDRRLDSMRWWICVATHLCLAVLVFHDCLQPGMIPYGRDTVGHDILFFQYGWTVTRALGEIPLWNHMLFAGWPWVAAAGWTPWYPLHWIGLIFSAGFAFTLQWMLHHAIAGLGFTVWARALGVRWPVALLSGALFQMSAHLTTLVFPGHLAKFEAIAWFPWVMAFGLRAMRGERRALVWAGLFLALQVLTQHAQIVYDTAIALGLMALWMGAMRSAPLRRTLAVTAMIGILGGLLGAVQLLPTTEMVRISNRADGVSWEEAVETSHPPRELIELVRPGLFGSSVNFTYEGDWGERLVSDYLGAVTLVGLLLCLIYATRDRALRKRTAALLVLFIITLLIAVGYHTPLYRLLYDWLPGWNRWRSPATIMFLTTFSAVSMAALGWGALLERLPRERRWALVGILFILGVGDLWRVDAKHVAAVRAPNQMDAYYQVDSRNWVNEAGLFGPLTGRAMLYGREMSNATMLQAMPVITGYHPIVLQRYQRLFEELHYNNPQLHKLLGVSWLTAENGEPLENTHYGEMLWAPRMVVPAGETSLTELRESGDSPFDRAPITGAITISSESTLTHTALREERRQIWLNSGTPLPPDVARAMIAAGSMGVGPANNELHMFVPLRREETRWVVISQIIAPGWRIVQPEELEIHEAWGALWAVQVTGPTTINAVYEPESVRLGLFISLCSLALVLSLLLVHGRHGKHRKET